MSIVRPAKSWLRDGSDSRVVMKLAVGIADRNQIYSLLPLLASMLV